MQKQRKTPEDALQERDIFLPTDAFHLLHLLCDVAKLLGGEVAGIDRRLEMRDEGWLDVAQRVPVSAKEERVRLDLVHRQSLLRPGHHPIQIGRLSKSVQRRVDE